jgi:hypothetical protein
LAKPCELRLSPLFIKTSKTDMELKTYGVDNLMDWDAEIETGKAKVRVHFTGGTATAYGVTPALYTTNNPFIQAVIENSNYFKTKRIKLIRKSGTPDVKVKKTAAVATAAQTAPEATTPEPEPEEETQSAETEPQEEHVEGDATDNVATDEVALTEVEVSCLTDAQVYLKENFGIATSKARSKAAAQSLANEHGITFVYPTVE